MPPALGTTKPAAHLYDTNGQDFITDLPTARGITWQHELSREGAGSFEIPLAHAAGIVAHSIVKFSWHGAIRFAVRIMSETCALAVDGTLWLKFDNQPGLVSLLADAVVFPESGLIRKSASSRTFGYMSKDGPWRETSEWVVPQSRPFGPSSSHFNLPADIALTDPAAKWIAFSDPADSVPSYTVNYFRAAFYVSDATDALLVVSGDNFLEMYLDGDQLVATDLTQPQAWFNAQQVPLRLAEGWHLFAARVENSVPDGVPTGTNNPIALIATLRRVDGTGTLVGPPMLHTDTASWIVSGGDPEPGWSRGFVLATLVGEAQDRGVLGPSLLGMDFDVDVDSDGESWTDRGEYTFSVGTTGMSDVAAQLSESILDVDVEPVTMTLQAWNRRGSDLSATVRLKLGNPTGDGSLIEYETTRATSRFTSVLNQVADGSWHVVDDAGGVDTVGRIETGLAFGSTNSAGTAAHMAGSLLAESAQAQVSVTGQPSALIGAVPYVDYSLGDSITVPGHRGVGTMRVRVLSITVDGSAEPVRAWPEFVQDLS